MAWSDILFVGQVRNLERPFTIDGNTIQSQAIRNGKEAKFSFERKQLVDRTCALSFKDTFQVV